MEYTPANSPDTPPLPEFGDKGKDSKEKSSKKESSKGSSRELPKAPLDKLFEKEVKPAAPATIAQKLGLEKVPKKPSEKSTEKPAEEALEQATEQKEAETEKAADATELRVDEFTAEESRQVAEEVIFDRHQQVSEELSRAVPESERAEMAGADKDFLETAREQLDTTQAGVVEALDTALEEAEMHLRADATESAVAEEAAVPGPEALAAELHTESVPASEAPHEVPADYGRSYAPTAAVPIEILAAAHNTGTPEASAAGGGAGAPPEKPPKAPSASEWYPSQVPWGSEAWNRRLNHYMRHRYERLKTRREIKRTEKNLETQMRNISHEVTSREDAVRQLAAEQRRLREAQKETVRRGEELHEAMQGLPERQRYVAKFREVLIPPPPTPPERHVAKASEALAPRGPVERPTSAETVRPPTRAETMPREELLRESAGMTVAGVTLRSVYEDKRISEQGLRRLVDKYQHGGKNMEIALAQEMVAHERSFELDPILREQHPAHEWLRGGGAGAGAQTAHLLTTQAQTDGQTATNPASVDTSAKRAGSRQQRVSDAQFVGAGFTILFIIVALIIILILHR